MTLPFGDARALADDARARATPCAVRRHLLDERGMDRQQLYTRGYWKLGAADHPDHDTGED